MTESPAVDAISIGLADDHALLRAALRELLQGEPDFVVVGEAGSGLAAVQLATRWRPDILLLDLDMPDTEPVAVVRMLRERAPDTKIIVLTMYDQEPMVRGLLNNGVNGYLHKSVTREILTSTIRTVGADHDQVILSVSRNGLTTPPAAPEAPVSARERQILENVALGLSNRQIAVRLGITEATVKRHLRNIFTKLDAVSRIDAVNKAVARSIIRSPALPPSSTPRPGLPTITR